MRRVWLLTAASVVLLSRLALCTTLRAETCNPTFRLPEKRAGPRMKLKQLEMALQDVDVFEQPKVYRMLAPLCIEAHHRDGKLTMAACADPSRTVPDHSAPRCMRALRGSESL